jgi:serine/threonine protein kinase
MSETSPERSGGPPRRPDGEEESPTRATAAPDDEELLAALADEFGARLRRREQPSVEEYVAKHPTLAERVRKVLGAVAIIEQDRSGERSGEGPGGTIGRYKLLERIGEGGFGVVYMAEQLTPVRRKVALKLLKPGLDTRQVIARFEAERQALALMDHECIAKVLDAGATDSGHPYFVMELVRGVPITEFCDHNRLPPPERLELFVQVCRAVQHAHTKGIIHRDIKPTNVLVTLREGAAVPKVIDFGVAKAMGPQLTERTLFTNFVQLVGTPLYMSPEQAEMTGIDVDTRSDVYSLGVLLYELLTGTTPVDKDRLKQAAFDEVRRIIREEEPPRPSTRFNTMGEPARRSISAHRGIEPGQFNRLVRGELDWIVMKALEKERDRRYETASGLAADVKRYLDDEPVQACPASAAYRVRKLVRRNKGPVLAASLILLALVAGVIGTSWGLYRAEQQRGIVERQRDELARRNEALRAANERARQAIEAITSATAVENLTRQQELRPEQTDFLDKMIRYYAEFAQEAAATEQERFRQARAYYRMGSMNRALGRSGDAEDAYRRAVEVGKRLVADFPTRPEYRLQLGVSHIELGTLLQNVGRLPEAESAKNDALAFVKQSAADFPDRPDVRQVLAGIHNNLGNLFQETGRLKQAEDAFTESLLIRKQLAADSPARPNIRRALAMSHNNLGWLFHSTGRLEKALPALQEAVSFQRQQVADRPDVPEFQLELGKYLINLGNALRDAGRPEEAESARAEGLAIKRRLVAEYPNRSDFRQELANVPGKDTAPGPESSRDSQGARQPDGDR